VRYTVDLDCAHESPFAQLTKQTGGLLSFLVKERLCLGEANWFLLAYHPMQHMAQRLGEFE